MSGSSPDAASCVAGGIPDEMRQAAAQLEQIRRKVGDFTAPEVELLLARIALADKRPLRSMEHLHPFVRNRKEYKSSFAEHYLLAGDTQLALNKPLEAALMFDFVIRGEEKRNAGDHFRGPITARAAEGAGRAFMAVKMYGQAEYGYKFGLDYIDRHLKPYKADLKDLIAQLNDGLRTARRAGAVEKYGEDFVVFRDAETQRRERGNPDKARELYLILIDAFPAGPYTEAAWFFEAVCLIQTGKPDKIADGEKRLQAFYAADRTGLYRGEALYELGQLAVVRHLDPALGQKYFAALDDWIVQARKRWPPEKAGVPAAPPVKNDVPPATTAGKQKSTPKGPPRPPKSDDSRLDQIKPLARELVAPPAQEWKKPDFWGNVKAERIVPGDLVNPQTCNWYLNNLEEHCAKFRGFLAMAGGDKKQAHEQFRRLLQLDARLTDGDVKVNPNDYTRLKFGAEHGYIVCYPQELKLYNSKQRFLIQLGEFYYVTEQYGPSRAVFKRLLASDLGKLDSAQEDLPHYMMGQLANLNNDGTDVFIHYEKVLNKRDSTWTELRATWAIMNRGRFYTDSPLRDRSDKLLREMAYSNLDNQYVQEARIVLASDLLYIDEVDEAVKVLNLIPVSNKKYYRIGRSHLEQIADPNSFLWRTWLKREPKNPVP